ncbi:trypsin-like peptidase domain-containing protein [Hydrogenophaga sp. BPS33]|uniref:trypsin-like peptidase domain-containing protein n=1 Tax=Hydrogenophaga sp. BPS33 TaxID=2651974 RepID=UPI001359EB72|nr:trypsin-like peptidase domain-containing protein [Hydrogenophaga sp. BPS33]
MQARARWLVTALVIGAMALAGALPARAQAPAPAREVPALSVGFTPNYRAIMRRAGPAVVGVLVDGVQMPSSVNDPADARRSARPFRSPFPFHGQGSGFIISPDGLVLTSAHVVAEARQVTVRLSDRREFRASVLGRDDLTDVAVLRIAAHELPILTTGHVDSLQVGDPVVAIGAPFGLEQSISHGIVSALGRSIVGFTSVPNIQTDAPVNPGHSGGPLLDASASVVGMHATIFSISGGYQGVSFAVPIDVVLRVKDHIVAHGRMRHAYLGATIQNLDRTLAAAFGQERPRGALVSGVAVGSPAAAAGLTAGDIITAYNGTQIDRTGDLLGHLSLAAPGERIRLGLWRARGAGELTVRLGEATGDDDQSDAEETDAQELGWHLRPLTNQERESLGVSSGVWVDEVAHFSAQAGLLAGDAILSINLKPVRSVQDVLAAVRGRPSHLALLIDRDGVRLFIPMWLE